MKSTSPYQRAEESLQANLSINWTVQCGPNEQIDLCRGKTGALSYFKPNDRLGLDLRDVENSMILGRTLIIDLHDLLHVDTQRRALRKRIADLANKIGKPAFKIDTDGCLLVVPGKGVRVDQKQHVLGTAVWREGSAEDSSPI